MSHEPLVDLVRRWEPPLPEVLAEQLPNFSVDRLIARGGMAAVYQGMHLTLERPVALKVLPPELGREPGFQKQFATEARLLARLQHPSIVSVYDFGVTPDGSPFIVMEYFPGVALTLWSERHTMEEKWAVALRVAEAVGFFHAAHVVHADLKPDNVLVDSKGNVKLIDFGLAARVGWEEPDEETPRFGTPPYTAPEAYRQGARPDPRSDIYSLAVTLFEFLTGTVPPRPAEPAVLNASLGNAELAELFSRMLDHFPENRPRTVDELRDLLTATGDGGKREARAVKKPTRPLIVPVAEPPSPEALAARRRLISIGVQVAAAGLVLGGMVALFRGESGTSSGPKAVLLPDPSEPMPEVTLDMLIKPRKDVPKPLDAVAPPADAGNAAPPADAAAVSPPADPAAPPATAAVSPGADEALAVVPEPAAGDGEMTDPAAPSSTPPPADPATPVDPPAPALEAASDPLKATEVPPTPAVAPPVLTPPVPTSPEMRQLNAKYIAAVARERDRARTAGQASVAAQFQAEVDRMVSEEQVPLTDEAAVSDAIKRLRLIYRAEAAKLRHPPAPPVRPPA